MEPLVNLKAFLAVMVILIVSAALLVAYFRDESPVGTGHDHGKMTQDDARSPKKSSGDGHAAMGHADTHESQSGQLKSQKPAGTPQPPPAHLEKVSGHAGMGHDKLSQSMAGQSPPMPEQMAMQAGAGATNGEWDIAASSALPGIPGLSRLYHIGATGFFLNQAEHIALTIKQQVALNRLKQKSLLSRSTAQRNIDEAEQQLWELTGINEPDLAQIQAKVEAIEKLRGEQRLAFIESVGEAVKLLTDEQRKVLTGSNDRSALTGHVHSPK